MEFDHILKLSREQLYTEASKFKEADEYDNYYIYLTMAANYKHKLAEQYLNSGYQDDCPLYRQNFSNTVPFYEATKDYSYSSFILGWLYHKGIYFAKDNNLAKKFYEQSIMKGNEIAYHNMMWVDNENYSHYTRIMMYYLFETNQEHRIGEVCGYINEDKIDSIKEIYILKKENDEFKYKNNKLEKEVDQLRKENNELKTHYKINL